MASYYADATLGDDEGTGEIGDPWEHCPGMTGWTGATTLSPGDTVKFKRGEAWRAWVGVSASGTEGNPITFTDYGTGNLPKIMGSDLVETWSTEGGDVWSASYDDSEDQLYQVWFYETDGSISWGAAVADVESLAQECDFFYDSDADKLYVYAASDPDSRYTKIEASIRYGTFEVKQSYITVENIEFLHARAYGVRFWGHVGETTYSDQICQDCEVHHIGYFYGGTYQGFGITAIGGNNKVLRNKVYQVGRTGIYAIGDGETQAGKLIEGNEIFNCYYNIIDLKNGESVDQYDVTIRYNLIYMDDDAFYSGVSAGHGIYVQETNHNLEIYYNIIYNTLGAGIAISADVVEAEVYNNVIYGAGTDENFAGISGFGLTGTGVIKNNIVMNSHYRPLQITSTNTTCDYNCYYQEGEYPQQISYIDGNLNETLAEHRTETGYDTNGMNSDPLFTDPANADFTLQVTSPCINTGVAVGLTQDYAGNIVGALPDIGAYEKMMSRGGGLSMTLDMKL